MEEDETVSVQSLELSQPDEEPMQEEDGPIGDDSKASPTAAAIHSDLPVFHEPEQILQAVKRMTLNEDEFGRMQWNMADLLTLHIPENLKIQPYYQSPEVQAQKRAESIDKKLQQIALYKMDHITNRIKEQKVQFIGIVTHVNSNVKCLLISNVDYSERR